MKRTIVFFVIFMLSTLLVSAHGEETFAAAEELINSNVSCDQLTDEQLETIGDYYMEQMHPGEAHEAMDEMMGGEGSANLKQMHINMAKSFYCGEHEALSSGMRTMMMGRSTGMMRGGMMNPTLGGDGRMAYGMMGSGLMGSTGWFGAWLLGLLYFAAASFVFALVFWYTYRLVIPKEKKTHKKK